MFGGVVIVLFQQQKPAPRQGTQQRGERAGAGTDFHDLIALFRAQQIHDALNHAFVAQKVLPEAFFGSGCGEEIDVAHVVLRERLTKGVRTGRGAESMLQKSGRSSPGTQPGKDALPEADDSDACLPLCRRRAGGVAALVRTPHERSRSGAVSRAKRR